MLAGFVSAKDTQNVQRWQHERNDGQPVLAKVFSFVWRNREFKQKVQYKKQPYDIADKLQHSAQSMREIQDGQTLPDERQGDQGLWVMALMYSSSSHRS
jgi:hypothetical protein